MKQPNQNPFWGPMKNNKNNLNNNIKIGAQNPLFSFPKMKSNENFLFNSNNKINTKKFNLNTNPKTYNPKADKVKNSGPVFISKFIPKTNFIDVPKSNSLSISKSNSGSPNISFHNPIKTISSKYFGIPNQKQQKYSVNVIKTNINIPKKQMNWFQAKSKYPKLNPFGDADRDGVININDCKPFNKFAQHKPAIKIGTPTYFPEDISAKEEYKFQKSLENITRTNKPQKEKDAPFNMLLNKNVDLERNNSTPIFIYVKDNINDNNTLIDNNGQVTISENKKVNNYEEAKKNAMAYVSNLKNTIGELRGNLYDLKSQKGENVRMEKMKIQKEIREKEIEANKIIAEQNAIKQKQKTKEVKESKEIQLFKAQERTKRTQLENERMLAKLQARQEREKRDYADRAKKQNLSILKNVSNIVDKTKPKYKTKTNKWINPTEFSMIADDVFNRAEKAEKEYNNSLQINQEPNIDEITVTKPKTFKEHIDDIRYHLPEKKKEQTVNFEDIVPEKIIEIKIPATMNMKSRKEQDKIINEAMAGGIRDRMLEKEEKENRAKEVKMVINERKEEKEREREREKETINIRKEDEAREREDLKSRIEEKVRRIREEKEEKEEKKSDKKMDIGADSTSYEDSSQKLIDEVE